MPKFPEPGPVTRSASKGAKSIKGEASHFPVSGRKRKAAEATEHVAAGAGSVADVPEDVTKAGSVIRFYSKKSNSKYVALSNFEAAPFELDGKGWKTVEHYFQACKFPTAPLYQEVIRRSSSPAAAKELGRSRAYPLRPDWEECKEEIMKNALYAKFGTHAGLKALLLSTGSAKLIEDSPRDSYWGRGRDGKGKNRLGVLLMEVRDRLKSATGVPTGM